MNKKKTRFLITLLAVMLCMTAFSSVAYAGGGPETEETAPTPSAEPIATQDGTPLDGDGNLITRDLLYDKHTNKQFITVETRNGKIFYIVIDYDKPVDEDLEQYHTYFLNMVDERDLLDIIEDEDLPEEKTPAVTPEPDPSPEPSTFPADEEPEQQNNTGGIVAVVLIVAVIGGGAVYFLKFRKPKQSVKGGTDLDEYDFEDEDEPDDDGDTEPDAGLETEDDGQ